MTFHFDALLVSLQWLLMPIRLWKLFNCNFITRESLPYLLHVNTISSFWCCIYVFCCRPRSEGDPFMCVFPYVAGWWRFPDMLHCKDVEANCLDILIFSMGIMYRLVANVLGTVRPSICLSFVCFYMLSWLNRGTIFPKSSSKEPFWLIFFSAAQQSYAVNK